MKHCHWRAQRLGVGEGLLELGRELVEAHESPATRTRSRLAHDYWGIRRASRVFPVPARAGCDGGIIGSACWPPHPTPPMSDTSHDPPHRRPAPARRSCPRCSARCSGALRVRKGRHMHKDAVTIRPHQVSSSASCPARSSSRCCSSSCATSSAARVVGRSPGGKPRETRLRSGMDLPCRCYRCRSGPLHANLCLLTAQRLQRSFDDDRSATSLSRIDVWYVQPSRLIVRICSPSKSIVRVLLSVS